MKQRKSRTVTIIAILGAMLGLTYVLATAQEPAPTHEPSAGETGGIHLDHRQGASQEEAAAQAMDQLVSLDVREKPIEEVIEILSKQTPVAIELVPESSRYLPYGSRTTLSATAQDRPLNAILKALLTPIGLEFTPDEGRILIRPTEPLIRLARRAQWSELDTLNRLYSQPWNEALAQSLKFQFVGIEQTDRPPGQKLRTMAETVGAGQAAEVLERACQGLGWTWYPEKDLIVILPQVDQTARQLEKRVSLRYEQVSLSDALLDLASQANVRLVMDPGVMAHLPPQTAERFSLSLENATVRQALEVVAGETGLSYRIEPDGIRITTDPQPATQAGESTPSRTTPPNRIVGHVTFPYPDGGSYSFFLREDDLPPELNRMREDKVKAAVRAMRLELLKSQPKD